MKIEEAIESLKLEILELQNKLNLPSEIKCNHAMCDLCINSLNNEKEAKINISKMIEEKNILLSGLTSLI
jgi:hypothetical protein